MMIVGTEALDLTREDRTGIVDGLICAGIIEYASNCTSPSAANFLCMFDYSLSVNQEPFVDPLITVLSLLEADEGLEGLHQKLVDDFGRVIGQNIDPNSHEAYTRTAEFAHQVTIAAGFHTLELGGHESYADRANRISELVSGGHTFAPEIIAHCYFRPELDSDVDYLQVVMHTGMAFPVK